MPTPRLTLRAGETVLELDAAGTGASVRHRDHPDQTWLTDVALTSLVVDGKQIDPTAPEVRADEDEVELVHQVAGRLRVVVRHTVAAGWGLRVSFANSTRETVEITDVVLGLRVGPRAVGWALAAGAEAAYSVHPLADGAPVLGGVLQLGSVDRVSADGLHLRRVVLEPGTRYVVQLVWDWYATPLAFGHGRHPQVPLTLVQTVGEVVEVRRDDDIALVTSGLDGADGLEVVEASDQLELASDSEGHFDVEQRSARGTTSLDLRWVLPVEAVLGDRAEQLLEGPRTSAGVVRLDGVADALVLQHALGQTLVSDTEGAADALDRYAATLFLAEDPEPADVPLLAAFGCGEFQRTGDPDALAAAVRLLSATTAPVPGLGLAATQACLGLLLSGQDVEPLLHHLAALTEVGSTVPGASAGIGPDLGADPVREAAELELLAVTWTSAEGPGPSGPDPAEPGPGGRSDDRASALVRRADRLGRWLGAGLKGRPVDPLPVAQVAHLSTVLLLLPDAVGRELRPRWGCSPSELAARSVPAVVDRLPLDHVDTAHVWLMLGQPPR